MIDYRITLALTAAVVAGVWLAARNNPATGNEAAAEPWPDLGDVLPTWGGEPDQTTSIFEAAVIAATPSTYYSANVDDMTASRNLTAFLTMIATAEGTAGPNGYRMLFGGQLFNGYADHPRVRVPFRNTFSTAAGRYQILARTWDTLRARLNLPNFGPEAQDAAAIELIRERGALADVQAGRVAEAVHKVRKVWASLPGAGYDQPERPIHQLVAAYTRAGGTLEA